MPTPRKLASLFIAVLLFTGGLVGHADADNGTNSKVRGAACRAVLWLQAQQKSDGGFGVGKQSSASLTADTVYVLSLLGEDVDGPRWTTPTGKNALDGLQTLAVPAWAQSDPGQAGKVARAVALAGANPRAFGGVDLVATIQGFYNPDTGLYHASWLFRHSLAIEGLVRSGATVPQAAYSALLSSQLPDGGWFWSKDGTQSDADTTGYALQVLSGIGHIQAATQYGEAASYLAMTQRPEGGWNTGYVPDPTNPPPPNGNSTALAVAGLMAAGYDPQSAQFIKAGKGALDTLLSFQEASGAFVYVRQPGLEEGRLSATADALSALAPLVQGQPLCKLTYLPLILAR